MDYNKLLDLAIEVGYRLALSGAETYRIEESVNRILAAYGIKADTFAIPNCLHASISDKDGNPLTRMRRIGQHGNDLDSVEKFSNLSRKICRETPSPEVGMSWLNDTIAHCKKYSSPVHLLGNFLGASGFACIFGGSVLDCVFAGFLGIIVGVVNQFTERKNANQFFRILIASFVMSLTAYLISFSGFPQNADAVIIGALMILVPGLLFTNAMRDIIYGDTNSGINRIVQVLLIAVSIAVGTAAALSIASVFGTVPTAAPAIEYNLFIEIIGAIIGCFGFMIIFNIHGNGGILCAIGGALCWSSYRISLLLGVSSITAYFIATFIASIYSEIMARIRKYPAISYLVISIFPLIPGAGVYYAMTHAVKGDHAAFATRGMETAAVAGVMAVGIVIASSLVRLATEQIGKRK